MKVSYNFENKIFKKHRRYKRLANEHKSIAQLKSDKIKWRVTETVSNLKIPIKYEIDYHVKSIIRINEDKSPVYGHKHTIEISFPAKFPIETFKAKTISPVWHPNIKWDGPTKGRICTNNKTFGRGYDIYMLLLRIGEIIQYKNYLAENIDPYPEDKKVAEWVLEYAEPNGIVNIKEDVFTDDSNLLEYSGEEEVRKKIVIKKVKKSNIIIGRKKNSNKKKNKDNIKK